MELSVRDTHKYVFPFFHYTRIFKWIQEGFLVPSVHVDRPSGPTTKTMLDPLDMVVCAVIHCLFRFGSEVESLRETKVSFYKPQAQPLKGFAIKKAGEGVYKFGDIGRKWQEYFMEHQCRVIIFWAPNVNENTLINVYPQSEQHFHMRRVTDIYDGYRPTFGNIFINTECWLNYVGQQLDKMK